MAGRVRWGVISTADIAVQKVIPSVMETELVEMVAIASRDAERARRVADRLGIPESYGSYEDLLASEIEAVYIPLPNHLHARWTKAAAAAGKHVLCEKPLGMNSSEAREMVDACRKAGVKLMEGFMYRLHPSWVRVRELVERGRLGRLEAIQTFFSYRELDPENIRNIPEYGGGALMDIGCYAIDLSRMLFDGEPIRVEGLVRRHSELGVDVLTSGMLEFEGDRHATFTVGTRMEPGQRIHLAGTEGRLVVDIPFNIPPGRPTRLLLTAGGAPPVAPDTEIITIPAEDQYAVELDAFSRAVLDDRDVPIPVHNAVADLEVLEALLASAQAA